MCMITNNFVYNYNGAPGYIVTIIYTMDTYARFLHVTSMIHNLEW